MKTYASAVLNICIAAFARQKIQFVVRRISVHEERIKNVNGLNKSETKIFITE